MDFMKEYPKKITCRKNKEIEVRILDENDIDQEIELYKSLSKNDQSKIAFDANDIHFVKRIRHGIEDELIYRIGALENGKLIAILALFVGRSNWIRHTADIRQVTHPSFRRFGIGKILFEEMILLAGHLKIEKIYARLYSLHSEAIPMLRSIGFKREATFKDHIKDVYGRYRSMRIYSIDLEAAHKAMDALMNEYHDYSG